MLLYIDNWYTLYKDFILIFVPVESGLYKTIAGYYIIFEKCLWNHPKF